MLDGWWLDRLEQPILEFGKRRRFGPEHAEGERSILAGMTCSLVVRVTRWLHSLSSGMGSEMIASRPEARSIAFFTTRRVSRQ